MPEIRVGQFLVARDTSHYQIVRVGEDSNGTPVIDVLVDDVNDFICREDWDDGRPNICFFSHLGPVVLKDLQYRFVETGGKYDPVVDCNVPWDGVNNPGNSLFYLVDKRER